MIREAFYSVKKLEMPGGGGVGRGWWGGGVGKDNGTTLCHPPPGKASGERSGRSRFLERSFKEEPEDPNSGSVLFPSFSA